MTVHRRHFLCACAALVLIAVAALSSRAFGLTTVGSISQLTGSPQVTRGGHAFSATLAMVVDLLDQLTTDSNSSLSVTFDDGSSLDLSGNSVLVIDDHVLSPHKTALSLLEGRMVAAVAKSLRASAPNFVVRTPNAFLAARGTRFKVKYADRSAIYNGPSTEVAVMEGSVLASNRSAPSQTVEVPAGYETVILGNEPPLEPGPIGLAGMGSGHGKGYPGAGPGAALPPPPAPPPAPPPL